MYERYFQAQLGRVDRLLSIVTSQNPSALIGDLQYEDVLIFTFQCMWHLKDWILNDRQFGARDALALRSEIESEPCLRVCADIANASKHLTLSRTKTGSVLSAQTGVHLNAAEDIFQVYCYVDGSPSDPYFGVEVRSLLRECRDAWKRIIDEHYLSEADEWLT